MAWGRKKFRKQGRRRTRAYNRRSKRRRYMRSANKLVGFPKSRLVKMRYVDTVNINAAVGGAIAWQQYRANSIFQCNYTSSGGQPLSHDQWSTFYDHYVVIGSKISVQYTPNVYGTTGQGGIGVCLALDDTFTTSSVLKNVLEQGNTAYRILSGMGTRGGDAVRLRKGFSTKKFFGIKDVSDNITRVGAQFGANPTEDAIYSVGCVGLDSAQDPIIVTALVTIDYLVLMSEPKELPAS